MSVIFSQILWCCGHLRKDKSISQKMKKNKKEKDAFRKELDSYKEQGVDLWLVGAPSTPKEIWKAHKIAEDVSYMRDYITDNEGNLVRLEFDAIKQEI